MNSNCLAHSGVWVCLLGLFSLGFEARASEALLRLGLDFRLGAEIQDFRPLYDGTDDTIPSIKINQSTTTLSTQLSQDPKQPFYLEAGLNVLSVFSTNQDVLQETEFDGFTLGVSGGLWEVFEYRLSNRSVKSPKNFLIDSHQVLSLEARLVVQDPTDMTSLFLKVGPDVAWPFAQAGPDRYALQWGLQLSLEGTFDFGEYGALKPSVLGIFRRTFSAELAGESSGGAGLLSFRPQLEYLVLDVPLMWIGFFVEAAIFRPEGRENIFGNFSLPGLNGTTVGLNLSLEAL